MTEIDFTKMRKEVLSKIGDITGDKRVFVSRYDKDEMFDAVLNIRIAVGPENDQNMEVIDNLINPEVGLISILDRVPDWESFDDFSFVRCSGHTMFPVVGGEPLIGAEWTIKAMV